MRAALGTLASRLLAILLLVFAASAADAQPGNGARPEVRPIGRPQGDDGGRVRAAADLRSLSPRDAATRLAEFRDRAGISRRPAERRLPPNAVPSARPVRLAGGTDLAPHGLGTDPALVGVTETVSVLVEFTQPIEIDDFIDMLTEGFSVARTLSDRLVLTVVPPGGMAVLERLSGVRGLTRVRPEQKVRAAGPGAPDDGRLYVVSILPASEAQRRDLEAAGFPVLSYDPATLTWQVAGSTARMRDVAAFSWVESVIAWRRPSSRTLRVPRGGGFNLEPDDSRELLSAPWIWNGQGGDSRAGAGVTVGVMDDGLKSDHPDFVGSLHPQSNAGTPGDHGTHVAGTVTGRGTRSIPNGRYNVRGMAPDATLLFRGDLNAWATNRVSFANNGALISNHSWGASWSADRALLTYDADCQSFDAWMKETGLLLVPAAGNDGEQLAAGTVGSPSNAKNPLTVGAVYYVTVGTESIGYITDYSSRGPTRDVDTVTERGRLQPTLMAPGGNTANTAGIIAPHNGGYTAWYADSQYAHSGGTSMAAPHVTGAATLVKQAFPSADGVLLKALLVNSAIPLPGNGADPLNGYAQRFYGYGLVNPFSAIYDVAGEWTRLKGETGTVAKTGTDSISYTLNVGANALGLAVTMAYNDDAGLQSVDATGADSTCVLYEDLDLVLVAPGGATSYRYNLAALSGQGVSFQSPLEKIVIENPAAGNWTARVEYRKSTAGALGSRTFGLAAHARYKAPAVRAAVSETITTNPGETFSVPVTFTNVGGFVAAGVHARITQQSGAGTITGDRDTTFFINNLPYGGASDSRFWIFTAPAETGVYTMRITTGMVNRGATETTIVFNVANGVPAGTASVDTSGPNAWYVNDTSLAGDSYTTAIGASANDGLTRATPKRNVHQLRNLLTAGDSVYIDAGTFTNESRLIVTVSGVTFLGVDSRVTVLDANYETGFWLIGADRTRIQNLAILNADLAKDGGLGQYSAGIYVQNSDSVLIVSDSFLANANGVEAAPGSDSLTVTGCWFGTSQNWGVYAETATRMVVTHNAFSGGSLGLYARSDSAVVSGNTVTGRTVVIEGADSAYVSGNTMSGNAELTLTTSRRTWVVGNTILDGKIVVNSGSSEARVADNACTIVGGTNIDFYGESGSIERNVVLGSGGGGYGIWLRQGAYGNLVRGNVAVAKGAYGFLVQGATNWIDSNTARQCNQGGFWFNATGETNLVTANLADRNSATGFTVNGAGNVFRANTLFENITHGFQVTSQGNVFRQNVVDSNRQYAFHLVAGNTLDRNAIRTSAGRPDSGLFADTTSSIDATRTWWFTTDSAAIKSRIWGRGRDSVVYTPFRLGIVDTALNGDSIAPAAPSGLITDTANGLLRLTWTAPTVNEDGSATPGVSFYRIYRARSADTTDWCAVAGETTALTFSDTTAASDTDYHYRVIAVDAASVPNASFYSGIVRGRGLVDTMPPVVTLSAIANNRPISETLTVSAMITSYSLGLGLQSVTLGVRTPNGTTDSYAMTSLGGGSYRTTVPASKIGATAGAVTINVTAIDTFSRSGNASTTFTIAASTLQIADSGLSFAAADTVWSQAVTGYVRILGSGDTIRVRNVTAASDRPETVTTSSGAATDTATVDVPLLAGLNVVSVTRIGPAGDSQVFTRWFVADTTAPVIVRVALDSTNTTRRTGDTRVGLLVYAQDAFGFGGLGQAAFACTGTLVAPGVVFTTFSGAETMNVTVTLTADSGTKTCTVTVRDRAGNTTTSTDTIILTTGSLGTVFAPATETVVVVGGETLTILAPVVLDSTVTRTIVLPTDSVVLVPYVNANFRETFYVRYDLTPLAIRLGIYPQQPVLLDTFPTGYGLDSQMTGVGNRPMLGRSIQRHLIVNTVTGLVEDSNVGYFDTYTTLEFLYSDFGSFIGSDTTNLAPFYFRTTDSVWVNVLTDTTMWGSDVRDSIIRMDTGIRVRVKHFTLIGISTAGGFTATGSVQNVTVFPNPYVPYDGNLANGEAGQGFAEGIYIGNIPTGASVQILDIRGRLVDEMTPAEVATNTNGLIRWDARNKDNQEVASGVYLIVIRGPGGTAVKKVAVVR